MRRNVLKGLVIGFVSLLALACLTVAGASCGQKNNLKALSAPAYVKTDFFKVYWREVENASGYVVRFPSLSVEVETEEDFLSAFKYLLPNQTYTIEVKAKGDGKKYADSAWKTTEYKTESVTKGLMYNLQKDDTYEVICPADNIPSNGKLVFPDTYQEKPVTVVSPESPKIVDGVMVAVPFSYAAVQAVRLPISLKELDGFAFYEANLREIEIPEGVKTLNACTFEKCKYLTSVSLPEGLEVIKDSAFSECERLNKINFPQSLREIGEKAFYRSAVKEINLPESLSFLAGGIDKGSFCETEWYNDHPDGVLYCGQFLYGYKGEIPVDTVLTGVQPKKAVAEGAFNTENCKNLKGIVLPEGYQTIGANAFRGCTALSEISLPDGLVSIGDNAFKDAILESVRLPDTLLSIGDGAFSGTKLTEINLPKTLKIVEAKVFANCKNLKTVILPSTLKTLNIDAFSGCLGLNLLIPKEIDEVLAFKPLSGIGGSSEPPESFKKAYDGVKIFYLGDETGWTGVRGEYFYDWIPVYYYSEDPPQESGKYWRYVDGVPTVWE